MAEKTSVGNLRHRITIQSLSLTEDGQGGSSQSWADLATVWAQVEPVSTRERLYAEQIEYQRTHKVVIRYLADLTAGVTHTHRFLFGGRTFQIKSVRQDIEKKFWTFIDAEENQGT